LVNGIDTSNSKDHKIAAVLAASAVYANSTFRSISTISDVDIESLMSSVNAAPAA